METNFQVAIPRSDQLFENTTWNKCGIIDLEREKAMEDEDEAGRQDAGVGAEKDSDGADSFDADLRDFELGNEHPFFYRF
jgi:hypothetical protein